MKQPTYCANCDAEATQKYTTEKGAPMPLCEICSTAFQWGQVNPTADLESLDATDDKDFDPDYDFHESYRDDPNPFK